MTSRTSKLKFNYTSKEDLEETEEAKIQWSNLIFLPFHPIFRPIVLLSVIFKTTLGPLQAVYPIVSCSNVMDSNTVLLLMKYFYWYCSDPIYGIDTFFHILHRQVTDKAMRREYLPKSAFLLFLDIIALIPFFPSMTTTLCPPITLWPNILGFSEFVIIYRVVQYFSLVSTHSICNLVIGFTLITIICINSMTSFLILITKHGLCSNCQNGIYDWRIFVIQKLNESDERYCTYVYATSFVLSFVFRKMFDETKPSTVKGNVAASCLMIFGYVITIFVVLPKLFIEVQSRLRLISEYRPHVQRMIQETKRRNPNPTAHISVKNFYILMWKKRNGITSMPEVITELPRYLRLDIRLDLVWSVFYHSPTFRSTSHTYKRWLCEYIRIDYKLPGEKLFSGPHYRTNLFYIKSGIVQLFSADDGRTPLLSVTSGTIFGDISFYLPPLKRNITVRCLTYCEVYSISRLDVAKSLRKYPEDSRKIIQRAKDRIKHARTLYACKQHVRGLDRTEDEGIAWVKKRWWEIFETISIWKKKHNHKRESQQLELPPEETVYHCPKYIGQLVLCHDNQLQMKSMFANVNFPWILLPNSTFVRVWRRIIKCTVVLVLLVYPPNITKPKMSAWFHFLQFWCDLIYMADICISLLTSIEVHENVTANFAEVMFARCKSPTFFLDVLSTIWIEDIVTVIGRPDLYNVCRFNRLIKIYMLFIDEYVTDSDVMKDPLGKVIYKITLVNFCFVYIMGHLVFMIDRDVMKMPTQFYFGEKYCLNHVQTTECDPDLTDILAIAISWSFEMLFIEYAPRNLLDVYATVIFTYIGFLIFIFSKSQLISALYLKYKASTEYQYFVTNLKSHYTYHKIHPDLLIRMERYFVCHWKYYHGRDVMNPNLLKDEPFDIYWKVHGEAAVKIISESMAFHGADTALIREIAYMAKFLLLPRNTTLILFGIETKNVTWLVKGKLKCEYHNEKGEIRKHFITPGQMLSATGVFLGTGSLRTYTSYTECETLYIKRTDLFNIIKHYPQEWSHFENAINEFKPIFQRLFHSYVLKHRDYQRKLRDRIFHSRLSVATTKSTLPNLQFPLILTSISADPESKFFHYWMLFRVIVVFVSITCASLQGGSGSMMRPQLSVIGSVCDCIAVIDIILKCFLPYYNAHGILITSKKKCITHYLTRGFLLDIIGALPWYDIIRYIPETNLQDDEALLLNTFCKFAHLYLLLGYFDYIADSPTVNVAFIIILKWQVSLVLILLGASHIFIHKCIDFVWDKKANLIDATLRNSCWMPNYIELQKKPTLHQVHLIYAESLSLAQNGLMRINLGKFNFDRHNVHFGGTLFLLGIIYWYVVCHSLTLLVLSYRSNTLFQHGISELERFLKDERVDKELIHKAIGHFRYWWERTYGINIESLMNERIGIVFRQDLNYYFYKQTLNALNTLLHGSETLERQLASFNTQYYFLPGEVIMREMDLMPWVFVVHRGEVAISQNGETLAILTKGAIFGQLTGIVPRPIRVTATAVCHADILQIAIKRFQEFIGDIERRNIERNPTSKDDYMDLEVEIPESPYNTIRYLLRGVKTIKLPWMKSAVEARDGSWYMHWLFAAWLIEPFITSILVLLICTMSPENMYIMYCCLMVIDVFHLAHFISEFYTVNLVVVNNQCKNRIVGFRKFHDWNFYVDAITLLVPLMTFAQEKWYYQMVRLLRLKSFRDYYIHFWTSFKRKAMSIFIRIIIIVLLLHGLTCGWIFVACRNRKTFPANIPVLPEYINETVDYMEWSHPNHTMDGCARITRSFLRNNVTMISFVTARKFYADYVLGMTYIILLATGTDMDAVVPLTLSEIYYKSIITMILFLVGLWIESLAISAIHMKFRELYQFDYAVLNLTNFLINTGLSPSLRQSVKEYTKQLWQRQRGNWLPELAQQAPVCLREDLLGALYAHHLQAPPLFRQLPAYFTRQLVARLQRIVIFPGKNIVIEGDIFSCIYFIHEGEVEKWYVDRSGENKLHTLLTTNGYFGFFPGLFPDAAYTFSYVTRTVVDLVCLRLKDWQDLLEGYPDVKHSLYESAKQMKDLK